jgi:hypothetical protein
MALMFKDGSGKPLIVRNDEDVQRVVDVMLNTDRHVFNDELEALNAIGGDQISEQERAKMSQEWRDKNRQDMNQQNTWQKADDRPVRRFDGHWTRTPQGLRFIQTNIRWEKQ